MGTSVTSKRPGPSWRPVRGAGVIAIAAFTLCGMAWGAYALRHHANQLPSVQLGVDHVMMSPQPEWVRRDLLRTALDAMGVSGSTIPLAQADLVARLGAELSASPWIERVRVDRRRGELRIEASYRRPVLFIPWGDGNRGSYLDEHGVVLPAADADPQSLKSCLVLEGVAPTRLPVPGAAWRDVRIRSACQLAGRLAAVRRKLDLVVLTINEGPNGPLASLRTRRGSRIEWGPPDLDQADRHVARLIAHQTRFGSLDQPRGPYYFDLTQPGDFALQPAIP